jgi:hypothetical protein
MPPSTYERRYSLWYTVKKANGFPIPILDVTNPARESLDSDILAGGGKMADLFLQCMQRARQSSIINIWLCVVYHLI